MKGTLSAQMFDVLSQPPFIHTFCSISFSSMILPIFLSVPNLEIKEGTPVLYGTSPSAKAETSIHDNPDPHQDALTTSKI